MAGRTPKAPSSTSRPLPPPATTPEGRQDQLIAAAYDLVEKRIHDGTASAQETVHFLRQGSLRERLEQEKMKQENLMLQAKIEEMEARKNSGSKLELALLAFTTYTGQDVMEDDYGDSEF